MKGCVSSMAITSGSTLTQKFKHSPPAAKTQQPDGRTTANERGQCGERAGMQGHRSCSEGGLPCWRRWVQAWLDAGATTDAGAGASLAGPGACASANFASLAGPGAGASANVASLAGPGACASANVASLAGPGAGAGASANVVASAVGALTEETH
eukprot:1152641-Pelagomonas_calceolata.AAC.11